MKQFFFRLITVFACISSFAAFALDEVIELSPGNSVTVGNTVVSCGGGGGTGGLAVFFSCQDNNNDGVWYVYANYRVPGGTWTSKEAFKGGTETQCNYKADNVGLCRSEASVEAFFCQDGNNDGIWYVYSSLINASGPQTPKELVKGGSEENCTRQAKRMAESCF